MLEAQWDRGNFVCVGLDSEFNKIPESVKSDQRGDYIETVIDFNYRIVASTRDLVCAYKPNVAFYEAHGEEGINALRHTIENIHLMAPDVPVILDAKHADIGNTNNGYVSMAFEFLGADAVTVHPYLGAEAMEPFLEMNHKGIIVLCRTSNPGAGEFQDLVVTVDGKPLYQVVAEKVVRDWNKRGNCALVVGATYPSQLQEVRQIVADMPILIPGVGFQQKDVPLEEQVKQVVENGKDSRGWGMIINSSRGIIFASKGPDFAEAARRETVKLRETINQYR